MGVSPQWTRFSRFFVSPPQLTATYLRCFYLGLHGRMLSSLEYVPGPQIISMPLKLIFHCKLTDSKQCCIPANLALKDRAFPMTNMVWWTFSSTQPPSPPRRIEPYVEIDPRIQPQYRRTSLPVEILNLKKKHFNAFGGGKTWESWGWKTWDFWPTNPRHSKRGRSNDVRQYEAMNFNRINVILMYINAY